MNQIKEKIGIKRCKMSDTLNDYLNELYGKDLDKIFGDRLNDDDNEYEEYSDYNDEYDVDNSEGLNDGYFMLDRYIETVILPFGVNDALAYFSQPIKKYNKKEPEENARFLYGGELKSFKDQCSKYNINLSVIRITPIQSKKGEYYELCFKQHWMKHPKDFAPIRKY